MADRDAPIKAAPKQPQAEEVIVPGIDEAAAPAAEPEIKVKRSKIRPLLMFGVPALLIAVVAFFWLTSGGSVSTDNAYVKQDKSSVSAEVGGKITRVAVRENQHVNAGDLLFEIDPAPYRIAIAQADAAIANGQVQLTTLQTSYEGTGADIQAARDALASAQESFGRQDALMKRGFTTRASYDLAKHAVEQARAQIANAVASQAEAKAKIATGAAVPGVNPVIAAAMSQREKAVLDLSRTRVVAPVSGYVSQSDRLQLGQMTISGLPMVTIVSDKPAWIEANFKETDLNKMRVGQPATATFDAYPGLKLKCVVQSLGALTGSESSVLPAQNANGNWVKVTQRVPVRLNCEKSPRAMIAGLTADVTVDVSGKH